MPSPKTKDELIQASKSAFDDLQKMIASMSKSQKEQDYNSMGMNKNLRDIISHLLEWQLFFLNWYKVGMKGNSPEMPAPGYTWQTTPELNKEIWRKYQDASLSDVSKAFKKSHGKIQKIIAKHSEAELFEKKKFHWTGSTSLAAYIKSAEISHCKWGIKKLKIGIKKG